MDKIRNYGFQRYEKHSCFFQEGYELVRADEYPDGDYPTITEANMQSHWSRRPFARKDTGRDRSSN
jgi:hypothetical protein